MQRGSRWHAGSGHVFLLRCPIFAGHGLRRVETFTLAGALADIAGWIAASLLGADFLAYTQAIEAPVVFVNSAFDYPLRFGERAFARAARNAPALVAPGVGHGVGLTCPQIFADAVQRLHTSAG